MLSGATQGKALKALSFVFWSCFFVLIYALTIRYSHHNLILGLLPIAYCLGRQPFCRGNEGQAVRYVPLAFAWVWMTGGIFAIRITLFFLWNQVLPSWGLGCMAVQRYFPFALHNLRVEWPYLVAMVFAGPLAIRNSLIRGKSLRSGRERHIWTAALVLGLAALPSFLLRLNDGPYHSRSKISSRQGETTTLLPWVSLRPDLRFYGQYMVAGDLDGDGQAELVSARHDNQSITTVIAMKLDGTVLWTWGEPNTGQPGIWCDLPMQIYDIARNGKNEVWLSTQSSIVVLRGKDGKEVRRFPLPAGLKAADCITFVDLRGQGFAGDVVIKDRFHTLWAYTGDWKFLWCWKPLRGLTCHHPTPIRLPGQNRDSIMAGFTLLDPDGQPVWTVRSHVNLLPGHVDCCRVLHYGERIQDTRMVISYCSGKGMAMLDGAGKVLWERAGKHYQSVDLLAFSTPAGPLTVMAADVSGVFGAEELEFFSETGQSLGEFATDYSRHHRVLRMGAFPGIPWVVAGHAKVLFDLQSDSRILLGPKGAFADVAIPPAIFIQEKDNDPGPMVLVGDLDGDGKSEIILHSLNEVRIYKVGGAMIEPGKKLGTPVNFTLY